VEDTLTSCSSAESFCRAREEKKREQHHLLRRAEIGDLLAIEETTLMLMGKAGIITPDGHPVRGELRLLQAPFLLLVLMENTPSGMRTHRIAQCDEMKHISIEGIIKKRLVIQTLDTRKITLSLGLFGNPHKGLTRGLRILQYEIRQRAS
jgi:hypothetical protein